LSVHPVSVSMLMAVSDDIGNRGEALFFIMLTRFCGRRLPYFRPHFLGEKFATLDYLVELIDAGSITPYFFVQVKTTTQGYTRGDITRRRLKVQIPSEDMRRLILYPAPTYVMGIDEREEVGYVISANHGSPSRISSLSTRFPLDCRNLELLWIEVQAFWQQRDMRFLNSMFSDQAEEQRP
jgi:hypothetical protein